jgi:ferric-dicitrate binding protein FerR (iron transport regulator)
MAMAEAGVTALDDPSVPAWALGNLHVSVGPAEGVAAALRRYRGDNCRVSCQLVGRARSGEA